MSSPPPRLDISSAPSTQQLSSSQSDPLVFHPFERLALEIGLYIWSEALPPPRILEFEFWNDWVFGVLESSHQPSALLSVNRESRTLFLQLYRKVDLLILTSNDIYQRTTAKAVWHFNPMIDTIYISSIPPHPASANHCLDRMATEISFRELRFLAVNHSFLHEILTLRNLTRFPAMKELCAITADPLWDKREDWNWIKVDGKIEIIEKSFLWNEDGELRIKYRETSIKDGIKWHKDRFLREADAQGLSMTLIPVIREMNILRGGIGMLGIGDW